MNFSPTYLPPCPPHISFSLWWWWAKAWSFHFHTLCFLLWWNKHFLVLYKCLGHVCFLEFTFQETTFQTFPYLFAIRKVGQRRTLSGQQKTLSSQRKIWFSFQKSVFPFTVFVFRKVASGKPLSKLSCVCFPLEKLVNGKHFPVKGKFGLVFRKVFSWKIWAENTFRKLWKI